ncbi:MULTISPECIES: lipopolysaccharide biosynthesis protein [Priestia]|uniref:lipopolysaccharide biosynthesis protein n=1 Tax=Priestia TaxID=2800373 RepID=UPI0030FC5B1C
MSSMSRNTAWSFLSIMGVQFINIITNIILARMLSPETFGILGMAIVFAGFAFLIQEAGLNSYLIYKKEQNEDAVSLTFWLNIILSIFIAGLLFVGADTISQFYGDNQVIIIIQFICIGILIGSIGSTHRALLMKNNQFKDLTKIDIIAEIVSSIAAIVLAMYINGLLAVSAKYVFRPVVQSILIFKYYRYPIKFRISLGELKHLVYYSSSILGSQFFMYLNNNVDFFLVGRFLGDRLLGIYTLAFQWGALARYYLSNAVARVLFPEVSKQQDDLNKLKLMYLSVISKMAFITLPICIGLALTSHEFIYVLYGEKWLGVVPVLQTLLVAGGLSSISVIGNPVLRGIGRPDLEMKLSIASFLLFTSLVLVGVRYNLIIVALAELCRVIIIEGIRIYLIKKNVGIKSSLIFKCLLPTIRSLMVMIIVLLGFNMIKFEFNIILIFVIKVIVGIASYVFGSFVFNRKEATWIISYVKNRNKNTKQIA